jgi:branched-chain amino acid transport system permease protein
VLALGLNLVWGISGLINLGLAGFFALGAYASALTTIRLGVPIAAGETIGFLTAALGGAILMAVTLRLRGDYLAVVTLGFAETVRLTASNEIWLTHGTDGLSGIPGPWRGVLTPAAFNGVYLAIVIVVLAILLLLAERLRASPYGRVLRAIRDDDQVATVAGKPVARFKIQAFALSAGVMGLAGALYGHYTSFVGPDLFSPIITIYIFLAVTLGGVGSNWGVVVGAVVLMALLEGTRFLAEAIPGLAGAQPAALREMVIGLALLVMMRTRPSGLLPEPTYRRPKRMEVRSP